MTRNRGITFITILADWVSRLSKWCAILLLFSLALTVSYDVLLRASTGKSTGITDEISAYMLVAMVFLGLAHTELTGRHISIDSITRRFPYEAQRSLKFVILFISICFLSWLAYTTISPMANHLMTRSSSLGVIRTPMWIPYSFIPLGLFIWVIQLISKLMALYERQNDT